MLASQSILLVGKYFGLILLMPFFLVAFRDLIIDIDDEGCKTRPHLSTESTGSTERRKSPIAEPRK